MTEEDDIDGLAGEYVLGSLDAAERRLVDARRRTDASLDAAIVAWERHLGPLNDRGQGVPPPAHTLDGILSRISGQAAPNGTADVVPMRRPYGRRWAAFTAGASALAASLVLAVGWLNYQQPPPPVHANGLRQTLQGLLGEARSAEPRADVSRATGWHQPHGIARLRCVSGRRRARCQGAPSPFARTQREPTSERPKFARVVLALNFRATSARRSATQRSSVVRVNLRASVGA